LDGGHEKDSFGTEDIQTVPEMHGDEQAQILVPFTPL
jgi:hypothetical protein